MLKRIPQYVLCVASLVASPHALAGDSESDSIALEAMIDPATGRLTSKSPPALKQQEEVSDDKIGVEPSSGDQPNVFSSRKVDSGAMIVDFHGRFMSSSSVSLDSENNLQYHHHSNEGDEHVDGSREGER